jgi:hypothetical protein
VILGQRVGRVEYKKEEMSVNVMCCVVVAVRQSSSVRIGRRVK